MSNQDKAVNGTVSGTFLRPSLGKRKDFSTEAQPRQKSTTAPVTISVYSTGHEKLLPTVEC